MDDALNLRISPKTASSSSPSLDYRPDIQGLRALAIIAVVACHAGWSGFGGGFVGVDMFFVISGFLITGLLVEESRVTGGVNFLHFFARRLRRLLPALLVVTVATLMCSRLLLAPYEYTPQAHVAVYVPLWVTNFLFAFAELDYFSGDARSNMFVHTWSLGVEEQFYLVWPLLIALILFHMPRGGPKRLEQGLLMVFVISLIASVVLSLRWPVLAFYMMPTRSWQFALGGLVFVLAEKIMVLAHTRALPVSVTTTDSRMASIAGSAGLLLCAVSIVFLDERIGYPAYAVLPAAGTALLLFSGAVSRAGIAKRLLALRGMQWLGTMSYSLYLWHWPVLGIGTLVLAQQRNEFLFQLALTAVSLILAMLTYALVENPLRHSPLVKRRPVLTVASSIVLITAVAGGASWMKRVAIAEARRPEQALYLRVIEDKPSIYAMGCDDWYRSSRVVACSFGSQEAERHAIFIGDSAGAQWFSALAAPLVQAGWKFDLYTKSACPIVDEPIYYDLIGATYENCAIWLRDLLSVMQQKSPDVIFLGSAASYDYSVAQWRSGTDRVLSRLAPLADTIYVIRSTYTLPFSGPACLARSRSQPAWLRPLGSCVVANAEREHDAIAKAGIEAAIDAYPNVFLVDPNPLVCPDKHCEAERDGLIIFRDQTHLTNDYVSSLAQPIQGLLDQLTPLPL